MYAVEALRAALGDDIASWAKSNQKPLVVMRHDRSQVVSSRVGGEPDLAESEEWPVFGEPAVFVCQIDFSEMPVDIREHIDMPESGLLRVFAPTESDQETGNYPLIAALFTQEDTIAKEGEEGQAVVLTAGVDYPNDSSQTDNWPWLEPTYDEDTYSEIIEEQHGYQYLFGYPWTGENAGPADHLPLLTLFDEQALWLDGEVLQLFIKPADLAQGNFSAMQAEIRMPY